MASGDRSKLFGRATVLQKTSAWLAILSALLATILIITWAMGKNQDESYMGGLDFGKHIANWHPVFMTSGMLLCGVSSFMTYRVINLPKSISKPLHGSLHFCAIVLIGLGLYTEFTSKNYTNKHDGGGHYANLYTMHALVGLSTVILYSLNYVLGGLFFLTSLMADASKKMFLPNHVFIGTFSLVMIVASIESGILDMEKMHGCALPVDEMNLNPASTYHNLQKGCQVANGAGIMALFAAFFAWYAMFDYARDDGEKNWTEQALLMDNKA